MRRRTDFDGAKIDWDLLIKRGKTAEEEAHDRQYVCKLIGGVRQNAIQRADKNPMPEQEANVRNKILRSS